MTIDQTERERDTAIRGRIAVGRYVRELREGLGLTQAALAEMVGMVSGNISKLEGGVRALDGQRAAAFAHSLTLDPLEFGPTVFGLQDPHLFKLVFPTAAFDPPTVPDGEMKRALATLDRLALRRRYRRRAKA